MLSGDAPVQLVLLGGSGDLSAHKLLPALMDLFEKGKFDESFSIIGVARTARTDSEYRAFVKDAIAAHGHRHSDKTLDAFCEHISYISGSFQEEKTFLEIRTKLEEREGELGTRSNRLFYLAVPPSSYEDIFRALSNCGMAAHTPEEAIWSRILVEKPFGKDLKTAQALDTLLSELYHEEQIYRIDHYLAKEAMQNLLSFRFANRLLQHSWNKDSIESVAIVMHETKDVGSRTNFYEGIGALRDVGQNHILQILALIAMKEPQTFTAETIRTERERVLNALIPVTREQIGKEVYRAQYEGYQREDGGTSATETYFELITKLSLPEWEGVPFYISAGKALPKAHVEVTITFKDVAESMFSTESCQTSKNQVTLTISPEQSMRITLNAKAPGLGFELESRTLSFTCNAGDTEIHNSYEKVLYDCIVGDQTLFTTTEEVLAAWRYITPILETWQNEPLHTYQKGTVPESGLFTKT